MKSTFNTKKVFKTAGITIGAVALALTIFSFNDDLFQISKNLSVFATLYKEVNLNYVDDINPAKMIKNGADAMLENLDPYTEFIPESEIEDYNLHYVNGQYGGIGAGILIHDNKVFVSDVFEGAPAQKADLRPGDQILKINDIDLTGKNNDQIGVLLKGPKGAVIKILSKRDDGQPTEKNLLRDEIKQPNVSYYGMVDGNMGYIKLDKFLENSAEEVTTALISLKKNNPSGIILDLRSNGGGILQEAVKIVNLFVARDVEVVSQKGKIKEKNYSYRTVNEPIEGNLPLVVLVNGHSASASEIVAGSLQDLDRAVIIGQRSYGKGLVQQTFNLTYGSMVKITIAKYFIPSGRCVQEVDYAHRKEDGSLSKVADSMMHEFKTVNSKRSVYDGSGVYPDLFIKQDKFADITQALIGKMLIFDYANKYRNTHPQIAPVKTFTFSDADYADFVKFLADKNYTYSTTTEKVLASFKNEATQNKEFAALQAEYDALKNKMVANKKNDLQQYKEEIRQVLENEIVDRYYFEKGRYEEDFKYDKELAQAIKTMQDKNLVASILKGEGTYKVIGKPVIAQVSKKADNNN